MIGFPKKGYAKFLLLLLFVVVVVDDGVFIFCLVFQINIY